MKEFLNSQVYQLFNLIIIGLNVLVITKDGLFPSIKEYMLDWIVFYLFIIDYLCKIYAFGIKGI